MTALGTYTTPSSARPRPSVQVGAARADTETADAKRPTRATTSARPPPAISTPRPTAPPRTPVCTQAGTRGCHHERHADSRPTVPAATAHSASAVAVHTDPAGIASGGPNPRVVAATIRP